MKQDINFTSSLKSLIFFLTFVIQILDQAFIESDVTYG